jgi:hypothetical protein
MAAYSSLQNTSQYGLYTNITADTLVKTGTGNLIAIIVASHTSGAVKIWDNTSAATTVLVNTYTYAAGSQTIPFYGAKFTTGLFVDVTGTQDITVVYN